MRDKCTFFRPDHFADKKSRPCHLCEVRGLTHFWLGRSIGVAAISEWLCSVGLGPQRIWKRNAVGTRCMPLMWPFGDGFGWKRFDVCCTLRPSTRIIVGSLLNVWLETERCQVTIRQTFLEAWSLPDRIPTREELPFLSIAGRPCVSIEPFGFRQDLCIPVELDSMERCISLFHLLCILPTMHFFPVHLSSGFVHSSPFFWLQIAGTVAHL